MLSLVVITYNEEANIGRCLSSAREVADEMLVVDSFSKDATVEIAKSLGARVIEHPFENYIQQKKWAIEQAAHDHILLLDADEALSDELRALLLAVKENWTHEAYYMNRLSRLGNRWIRHGAWYPDRKMRLFDRRKYQITGVNPHDKFEPLPGVATKRINADILHFTNDSLHSRVDTINRFSTVAAKAMWENGKKGSVLRILFKPVFRFVSEYIVQMGLLDGFLGFFIAKTSAQYVFLRECKLYEHSRSDSGAHKLPEKLDRVC